MILSGRRNRSGTTLKHSPEYFTKFNFNLNVVIVNFLVNILKNLTVNIYSMKSHEDFLELHLWAGRRKLAQRKQV